MKCFEEWLLNNRLNVNYLDHMQFWDRILNRLFSNVFNMCHRLLCVSATYILKPDLSSLQQTFKFLYVFVVV